MKVLVEITCNPMCLIKNDLQKRAIASRKNKDVLRGLVICSIKTVYVLVKLMQ